MPIQEIISARLRGLQVRVGQGPGQTKYLAFIKHGGYVKTWKRAKQIERELEARFGKRTRHLVGRMTKKNRSGLPGLRFEWRQYSGQIPYLYLVGSYSDANGECHTFCRSVEKHGFDGALNDGLSIRKKHGTPPISFDDAKAAIWQHYLDVSGIHSKEGQK